MSEQTPEPSAETADQDGYMSAEPEPSMEDILASIRKIIADDADPVPMDGPGEATIAPNEDLMKPSIVAEAPTPTKAIEPADIPSREDVMPELTNASLDAVAPKDSADSDSSLDIESFLMEFGGAEAVGIDTPEELTIPVPEPEQEVVADVPSASAADVNISAVETDDDMDRLMDELMSGLADEVAEMPMQEGPVAAVAPAPPMSDPADDEMDLVKSLMADLTDDEVEVPDAAPEPIETYMPEAAAVEAPGVQTPMVDAPAVEETAAAEDDLDALEDDIFDSLMDMALAEDAPEAVKVEEPSVPSLSDIAAAAEADAQPQAVVEDIVAEADVIDSETVEALESDISDAEPETFKTEPTETTETLAMETPMPRAVRSDAILDDMTEEATMSAFAQLNQVVEDKAILSERGPRIGDLVQEALKPMLKEWLDENLQGIVERAVAKEVKRIATGK